MKILTKSSYDVSFYNSKAMKNAWLTFFASTFSICGFAKDRSEFPDEFFDFNTRIESFFLDLSLKAFSISIQMNVSGWNFQNDYSGIKGGFEYVHDFLLIPTVT